jgi:uncharacterized protein
VNEADYNLILELGDDIIGSERFQKAKSVPHHSKNGNIALHSLETTGFAIHLARQLKERGKVVNMRDVVRASLLHDIGMTVDAVFLSPPPVKGKSHPKVGACIAKEEFGANANQVDAILRHMWPVCTIVPPHTIEGIILTCADKMCSIAEVQRRFPILKDKA